MLLKLDYELKEVIDTIIGNLMEFGLIDMWRRWNSEPPPWALIAEAKKRQSKNVDGNVVLTVDHIVGALVIMTIGYILATIAFFVERLVYRKVREGTSSYIFLYLHKFLYPSRIDFIGTDSSPNNW